MTPAMLAKLCESYSHIITLLHICAEAQGLEGCMLLAYMHRSAERLCFQHTKACASVVATVHIVMRKLYAFQLLG